jgi:3-methylfumaryl-CoA hydratase
MTSSLGDWQPVTEVATDTVTAAAAAALHGLLDASGDPPADGDPLPALWHWLAFLPRVPQRDLGADGHPKKGGFLPPVPLPRRMFVGGRIRFGTAAYVGAPLLRSSTVASVEDKTGRSGRLVFVAVHHQLATPDSATAIVEEQDLVYREPTPQQAAEVPVSESEPTGSWPWTWDVAIDPTVLFRFSALTYNAHRIHYDRPYATGVEGYPGLVVHGPLQAVALAELCRRQLPDRALTSFRFRALRPAFDDGPLQLRGRHLSNSQHSITAAAKRWTPTPPSTPSRNSCRPDLGPRKAETTRRRRAESPHIG